MSVTMARISVMQGIEERLGEAWCAVLQAVIPAKARIHFDLVGSQKAQWIRAFAGMTVLRRRAF
jgi:hypothetical protein